MNNFEKSFGCALIAYAVFCLAVTGIVGYVTYHFISKWW